MKEMRLISPACLVLIALSANLYAKNPAVQAIQLNGQLAERILQVRTAKTINARTEAAEQLAMLTRRINPHKVDDATLAEMVSLLETQEDSVRAWVAASLGHLGPRAKVAAPTLLKLLPQVDCLRGSLTSAPFIRVALKRMRVILPPPAKCG